MTEVIEAAGRGLPVLGICNGFQILCESHLLPGALIRNDHRKFVCRDQRLRIENNRTAWTSAYAEGAEVTIVLKNGEGGYVADADTLDRLEGEGRVVARYLDDNPNGSLRDIAGITNERGNVVGLMPHPEHAVEELSGAGHRRARRSSPRCVGARLSGRLSASAPDSAACSAAGPQRLPASSAATMPVGRDAHLPLVGAQGCLRGGLEDAGGREPAVVLAALSARWTRRTSPAGGAELQDGPVRRLSSDDPVPADPSCR